MSGKLTDRSETTKWSAIVTTSGVQDHAARRVLDNLNQNMQLVIDGLKELQGKPDPSIAARGTALAAIQNAHALAGNQTPVIQQGDGITVEKSGANSYKVSINEDELPLPQPSSVLLQFNATTNTLQYSLDAGVTWRDIVTIDYSTSTHILRYTMDGTNYTTINAADQGVVP